jgi:flagellar biosynthetic protein FlhB
MDDHGHPRTEAATPRRRREAREQGQVALSQELTASILLLACIGALWWGGAGIGAALMHVMRSGLSFPEIGQWQLGETVIAARWFSGQIFATTALIVGVLFAVGLATGLLQSGFQISFKPLAANWERLSPTSGWSKLMSWDGAVRGLSVSLKVAAVGGLLAWFLSDRVALLAISGRGTLGRSVSATWTLALQTAAVVAGAFFVVGAADYLYQRLRFEQRLKMTRDEVKREHKEDEGDPHVRARIRKLQREAAEKKMIQDVPKATVVVTNPTHVAVALQYDRHTMAAPKVIAKGSGLFARRIREVAAQHGIPVLERKPLARLLFKSVRIGQFIPAELYQALAEILAHVYRLKRY